MRLLALFLLKTARPKRRRPSLPPPVRRHHHHVSALPPPFRRRRHLNALQIRPVSRISILAHGSSPDTTTTSAAGALSPLLRLLDYFPANDVPPRLLQRTDGLLQLPLNLRFSAQLRLIGGCHCVEVDLALGEALHICR